VTLVRSALTSQIWGLDFMRARNWKKIFILTISVLFFFAVGARATGPSITSLSPTAGAVGATVTITGTNFGSTQGTSTAAFNGTTATITSWSATSIVATVPTGATTGNVVVTVSGNASNGVSFTVVPAPSVSTLSPTTGAVGAEVAITGANFGATQGTGSVRFNGTAATPTSWSASSIAVPVPSGATTGNVVVNASGVASNGVSFTVVSAPTITSLSVTTGTVGTPVTISGTNFGATQGSGTVSFNGTEATPTSWSASSIVVTVPVEATTGNVVVNASGVASNGSSFTVVGQTWANGCLYRRSITIDHTKVPNTDQANFPVLVSGTYSYLATTTNSGNVANANGFDILFASDANGASPLSFEQESYNPSTGAVVYWVKLATVSHTTDTVFYMFYGNSSISTSQSNKTAVWDSNYLGIWHSGESSGNLLDSSSHNNPAAPTSMTQGTAGKIGNGATYNGSSSLATVGNLALFNPTLITASAWINASSYPNTYNYVLSKDQTSDPYVGYDFRVDGGHLNFYISTGGVGSYKAASATQPSTGSWHHVVGTYDGSNIKLFLDGSQVSSVAESGNMNSANGPLVFGNDGAFGGGSWNGSIDEVRISSIARSADWVSAEYQNQNSPSTFYSLGSATQGTFTVSITGLSPSTANLGDSVVIQGTNFGASQGNSAVSLNGVNLAAQTWGNSAILVTVPLGASSGYFTATVNGQTVVSPLFTVRPILSGWSDGDIGTVGLAGNATYSNGTLTVNAAGQGILNTSTADSFHFVYQPLSGDGTIVARVLTAPGGYTQAGVMIRETLDQSATHAYTADYGGSIRLFYRTTTGGGNSYDLYANATPALPFWVKLVRSGSTFSGYTSPDGLNWYQVGTSHTISMAQNVYIGLAVSSDSTTSLATATFDSVSVSSTAAPAPVITNVSATTGSVGSQVEIRGSGFGSSQNGSVVTLNDVPVTINSWISTTIVITIPSGATSGPLLVSVAPNMNNSNAVNFTVTTQPLPTTWLNQDVGLVGTAGSATYNNGTFTVNGAGQGIVNTSTSDSFQFVYQPLSGDGTIVARVVSVQNSSTQAGVMIRETLDQAATHAYAANYGGALFLLYRSTTGGSNSRDTYGSATPPLWVKLVRSGSTFSAYTSSDALNWYQVGTSHTITMAQNVYIGLAVSSQSTTTLAAATFDSVSINSTASPAPVITSVSATTGSIGSQVVITGSGFGASQYGSLVTLNNSPMTINSWSNTSIIATIPTGATSGPLLVSVAPSMNNSNAVNFVVTTHPLPTSWLNQDVGLVGVGGSATFASGTFTVNAAGQGIVNTYSTDSFHFVYQPLSGDGTIVARVVSLQQGQAGVMIRETLDQASTDAYNTASGGAIQFYYRTTTGGSNSRDTSISGTLPYWMKLVRTGSTFNAYASSDGVNWSAVGTSHTISMAQNVYVGLAVSSQNTSSLATATFDNVAVTVGTSPFVTSVSPDLGGTGTVVTITGSNFGSSQGSSTVSFNGTQATSITSWNSTQIVATVPSATPAGPGPVTVTVNSITSPTGVNFTTIKPAITTLTPPAAGIGGSITIAGTGFGASQVNSTVKFNGLLASVTLWSDTSITATVPSGATTGPVTVTEYGVTSSGVQFTVLEGLSVTGVSPSSGPVGTTVTISGAGFGPTQSNSIASFYGMTAAVTSWSDTQIVTTVPVGAATGPVGVQVAGQSAWSPSFTLTSTVQTTDSLGNPTTYTTQETGGMWVSSTSQGSGCSSCTLRGTIAYTYDSQGRVLSRTDELGHTTSYTYDSNGNVASVSVPIAPDTFATTTYTYNSFGEVLTTTDPMGNTTTNTYDSKGNLLTVTTPRPNGNTAASVTQFAYNSLGELTQITDPLNNVTTLTYYSTGLINTIKDAQNNVTTYVYDAHGNRTSVTDALNNQTTFAYDTGDRLKTITYPGSTGTTTFTYDNRGRRTSVTDQNSKTTTYAYDDADRLTSVTDASSPGNVTTYGYDTENNLTSIQDANSHTTSFTYDAFGRVTKTTFPSGYIETYGYDAVGNLLFKTDRKNQNITYTYDQLNRLTQKLYPDSTAVNYTYDNDSRLTQVTDPTGTYQFTFDNMGRLTNTTTTYAFLTGRNFTTSYSYDAASNRTGFTDPESGSTSYAYDTLNRLQTLTPPSAFSSTGNFGFTYDALSRRTQMTRPNSLKSVYAYDNLSRLTSVLHQSGSTTLDGAAYAVDNAGNRTSRTPQPSGTASNYTYDAIYELTGVTQNSTTTESYTYDPVGNRLSSLGVSSYTNNSSNELTSTSNASYTYDNNGNTHTKVVGSNTTTYAWDYENRMTSVTLPGSGGTVSFKYDPFGRRIYKSFSAGTTSVYAFDGDNLIEETNSSGAVVARYEDTQNIDEPLAMLRSSATSYFHADGLGSITSLSNSAGSIANTYTYDSFGKLTASTGSLVNPFQYTARESDTETGLYYYRARYYDPGVGRFISEDSQEFWVGDNFYRYVSNRPSVAIDPSGLVTVIPLPPANIHTLPDIDPSCVSPTNPSGVTSGGCNKVGYSVDWTGCDSCTHTPSFTITLGGSIFVASGPFPYKGRPPKDHSIVSTETALAHEKRHTDDMVNAIVPIFQRAERPFPSQAECEAAAEAAAMQAAPAWDRAAAESQRRRH